MAELWYEDNWEIASKYCYHRTGDPRRWGRLVCQWNEKKVSQEGEGPDFIVHFYAPLIDLHTGKVYLEMNRKAVLIRLGAQPAIRLIYTIFFKTLYHLLLPCSIPLEIRKGIIKGRKAHWGTLQTAGDCSIRVIKSLADMIRTPFYGTVLILHSLVSAAIGSVSRMPQYDLMIASGKIERRLYWGKLHAQGTVYNCFQRDISINKLNDNWINDKHSADTIYTPLDKPSFNWALANYGRAFIRNERDSPPPSFLKHSTIDPDRKSRISDFMRELYPLNPPPNTTCAISKKAEKRAAQWRRQFSKK